MKKLINRVVIGVAFVSQMAGAEIIEIKSMKEIQKYISPDSLLVFDLDNTVIEAAQTLGSDQWFDHMLKTTPIDETIALWSSVQRAGMKVRPVEAFTPKLIFSAQKAGFRVIALTARPESVAKTTLTQLASVGVRFEKILSIGPKVTKGEALTQYLANSAEKFDRILFMDDKARHVTSVNDALSKVFAGEHYEFRYGGADERVKAFNPAIAQCELEWFQAYGTILSDGSCAE